ncbi:MAG: hypothetical protein JNL89_00300 [Rhodanobacteraceae bacterium]|nr:hypothetical protein [Rhodanobacteraceae bacterium]
MPESAVSPASAAFPARLHILLASNSSRAVVIRRGPSRHTAVIGWEREGDRFELGQWLYGRIYERRCDLSPDGRHLIYFAMNGRWQSRTRGSWTAISLAPWLKALTLHAKGDCWNGGGLFLGNREYWLNGAGQHQLLQDHSGLRPAAALPFAGRYGGECPGVYYHRLQRDGWTLTRLGGDCTEFAKRVNAHWRLVKLAHATIRHPAGKGCYFDTHRLDHVRGDTRIELPDWEWAEVDGRRLVWAAAGRLYAGRVDRNGLGSPQMLQDFNPMRFERRLAPY